MTLHNLALEQLASATQVECRLQAGIFGLNQNPDISIISGGNEHTYGDDLGNPAMFINGDTSGAAGRVVRR